MVPSGRRTGWYSWDGAVGSSVAITLKTNEQFVLGVETGHRFY
ncbi:hypothetical protein [Halorubrum persicum]|nr:hypothetical protein [Halorubrum persicum]